MHDPATDEAIYSIPLSAVGGADPIVLAAHADIDGEGAWADGDEIAPGKDWSTYFTYDVQDCAVKTIGETGGVVQTTDGTVVVVIPPDALDGDEQIRITPVDPSSSIDPLDLGIPGTFYDLEPDGLTFDEPVTVTIQYDEAELLAKDPSADEATLGLAVFDGVYDFLEGSTVDTVANTVTGEVTHFSPYYVSLPPAETEADLLVDVDPILVTQPSGDYLAGVAVHNSGRPMSPTSTHRSTAQTVTFDAEILDFDGAIDPFLGNDTATRDFVISSSTSAD